MIDLGVLKGSSFVVLGLARSGLATGRALKAAGVDYVCWDDNAASRDAAVAAGLNVADPAGIDWTRITALVISPGIPSTYPEPHPVAAAARAADRKIICDVELLARAQGKAKYVAITGTNGKSTTTALIGHILDQAGMRCEVGGNIGRGALDLAPLGTDGTYVLELSSYQLELLETFHAHVAVWLNITPDHIDRHGDLAGYVAAKENIFARQQVGDCAVIGIDDEPSRAVYRKLAGRGITTVPVQLETPVAGGVSYRAGMLVDADGYSVNFADVPTLPGDHNAQNAACAWATCRWLSVAREKIVAGLKTYPGLPHRQERVASVGTVVYINDSKATNADATARALSSYRDIYWILGGQAKEGGVAPLAPWFDRIRHAFLIGEATDLFAGQLEGRIAYSRCGDLKSALDAAHERAQGEARGEAVVVLLSPACASWDQWKSYEHRGDAFRAMARALPGAHVLGRAA